MIVTVFNWLIFLVVFLTGSVGFVYGGILAYVLSFIALFLYWAVGFVQRFDGFAFPKTSILLVGFLIFSSVSLFFSVNKESSVYFFLQYTVLTGVFLFGFYRKELLQSFLEKFLVVAGIILCVLSLVVDFGFLVVDSGYQLIFSRFGSHNHLGDFLVLPVIVCIYQLFYRKRVFFNITLLIFFLSFFLLSYSRSGYLTLVGTGLFFLFREIWIFKKRLSNKFKIGLVSILFLVGLLFPATVFEARSYPVLRELNYLLTDNFGLEFKSFSAKRLEYIRASFSSIENHFWFGVGPGNFREAALVYYSGERSTDSSHNIFLDILVENGVFAFVFFLLFVAVVFKQALGDRSVFSLFLIALLVNFQTDYMFRISSVILLFFLLIGLVCSRGKRNSV